MVELPFAIAAEITTCAEGVHRAVARRSFRAVGPAGLPARVVHDAIAGAVYATVRGAARASGRLAGAAAAHLATGSGRALSTSERGALLVSSLNGAFGDRLREEGSGLAIDMAVRQRDRDVAIEEGALRLAFPEARPRLAIFLHGLCENEHSWEGDVRYGSRLEADLGYTPVYVRYNSGLPLSENGLLLARLLEGLVLNWPLEVTRLALIGHSMGGLVIRSALEQAGGMAWPTQVGHVFLLGTPNAGAPLEKLVNLGVNLLRLFPESRPFGKLVDNRSAGIKDLRHGFADVPLRPGPRHHLVAATLTQHPQAPLAVVLGDLLVRFPSAMGEGGGRRRPLDPAGRHHLGGAHHFDLLHHQRVYDWIRREIAPPAESL